MLCAAHVHLVCGINSPYLFVNLILEPCSFLQFLPIPSPITSSFFPLTTVLICNSFRSRLKACLSNLQHRRSTCTHGKCDNRPTGATPETPQSKLTSDARLAAAFFFPAVFLSRPNWHSRTTELRMTNGVPSNGIGPRCSLMCSSQHIRCRSQSSSSTCYWCYNYEQL